MIVSDQIIKLEILFLEIFYRKRYTFIDKKYQPIKKGNKYGTQKIISLGQEIGCNKLLNSQRKN